MWLTEASVVDVLTGDVARGRAVEVVDGRIGQITDRAPDGAEDVHPLGGRYLSATNKFRTQFVNDVNKLERQAHSLGYGSGRQGSLSRML